jgi:nucleotide-binding universal stress UspA family protein
MEMAYKSILTVCTDASRAPDTFTAAAKLAMAQGAHLDVLALGVDRTQVGYSYMGAGAVILQVAQERAQDDAKDIETAIRQAAEAEPGNLHWSVEGAVAMLGSVSDLVTLRARFADLVVLSRPYGENHGAEEEAVVEAALFDSQAPVLVLPEKAVDTSTTGKRVVIAWNQSREALSAIHRAMPFLQQAEMVSITIIDPPSHGAERSDPGGALCQMLVRHGIKAEVSVLAKTLPRISDVLTRHVRDVNADLLVMGAYGHSRFREAILGGATRNLLEHAEIPVLMAH